MKKFVTIFEKCENIHLIKDVGQIPYLMHRNYGFNSSVLSVKNSPNYSYLDNEVSGLKMEFIPKLKIGRFSLSIIWYLIRNSKKIDILHLFHHREPAYIYAIIYKKLNPNGHVYLKSDKGYRDIIKNDGFFNLNKKRHQKRENLFKKALEYIDTVSVENEESFNFLIQKYQNHQEKFLYMTNALDIDEFYKKVPHLPYREKDNIILTVGRIGAKEKNNQLLLDAIINVKLNNWKLIFIGPIEKEFQNNINTFYLENPEFKEKIIFTGAIYDRKKLLEYYAKAKLFCLTSIEESFGFVFIEAMSYGEHIITTDVSSARDITSNEKYGKIIHSKEALTNSIEDFITHNENYEELSLETISYVSEKYNWNSVIDRLAQRF